MSNYLNSDVCVSNFSKILKEPNFIDKSLLIEDLIPSIDIENRFICITRPRRFGKTKDIPEVKAGSLGEISADVSFGEVIGTFKVISKSGGFVNCLIENLTHRIPANSYIRIQTGQKAKEK